ncbi:uncharacterized protein DS421_11g341550 [Arachis hypogaea]|nr:uncharacterized protein DS421_11g341550 [Arachis hypogaea]
MASQGSRLNSHSFEQRPQAKQSIHLSQGTIHFSLLLVTRSSSFLTVSLLFFYLQRSSGFLHSIGS